jgi:4-amino-4-deoxy-L-arabinose transferase-like glycosyltransferase
MMLVFPLLMVVFAFVSKADRVLLKNPRFWLSMIVGAAFLLPVLWWNEQHAWITLEHTKHHFDTKSVGFGKWLTRTLEWPGVQALVYTPVTWAALIYILLAGFRYWPQMARRERFLILFSGPALIVFSLLALRQRINPNWPAVFYVPAFILVGAWFTAHLPVQGFVTWKRWTLRVAGTVTLLLHLALPVVFLTSLKGHPKLNALRGWEQVGQQMGQYLKQVPRPQQTQVLALGHRYHAAQLAFYMPQHPRLFRFEPLGHAMSQYEVWPGLEQHLGDDVLIMTDKPVPKTVSDCFERVEPFGEITLADGDAGRVFEVFLGQKLNTWKKVGVR